MTDIQIAKQLLIGDNTCVLVKGEQRYISQKRGIAPMMGFIAQGVELLGFSVADKIVGKAAAMLFVKAGIRQVFAQTISAAGLKFLEDNKVKVTYEICVDVIINRKGDGMCPMEKIVLDINDFEEGYGALCKKLAELSPA